VDVDRVVLVGHSAGGHLALWSAARHQLPGDSPWKRATPLRLRGVVALAAVSDLAMAAQLGLGQDATVALMDGRPGTLPDRYGQGDPASLVPSGVPTVLVHGVDDTEVPCVMSRAYATRAREAGDEVELVELPGTGHYDLIDPRSEAWATVSRVIRDMLR
jgi:acetyl esterase/lipase